MIMACTSCGRGFHDECEIGCEDCHSEVELKKRVQAFTFNGNPESMGKGQPTLEPADVREKYSTGRKRAAQLYPLFLHRPCEWQGKKNCGGGLHPITGCIDKTQTDRHHGPIKDTLENSPGNVHRICSWCHNRWHTMNDAEYDEAEYAKIPHAPEPATEMELVVNEAYWLSKGKSKEPSEGRKPK